MPARKSKTKTVPLNPFTIPLTRVRSSGKNCMSLPIRASRNSLISLKELRLERLPPEEEPTIKAIKGKTHSSRAMKATKTESKMNQPSNKQFSLRWKLKKRRPISSEKKMQKNHPTMTDHGSNGNLSSSSASCVWFHSTSTPSHNALMTIIKMVIIWKEKLRTTTPTRSANVPARETSSSSSSPFSANGTASPLASELMDGLLTSCTTSPGRASGMLLK
mmetsp:Transcript_51070/g.94463  ORF Transcript_51070/g.94463 Transcript_51070/m.94463 type:complete len:219 (+) Transcript_51070:1274-1930(+)